MRTRLLNEQKLCGKSLPLSPSLCSTFCRSTETLMAAQLPSAGRDLGFDRLGFDHLRFGIWPFRIWDLTILDLGFDHLGFGIWPFCIWDLTMAAQLPTAGRDMRFDHEWYLDWGNKTKITGNVWKYLVTLQIEKDRSYYSLVTVQCSRVCCTIAPRCTSLSVRWRW